MRPSKGRRRRGPMALVGLLVLVLGLLAASLVLGGCSSVPYLAQSVSGHLDLLNRARPVDDWLQDSHTPQALRERLQLSQRIRDFAVQELKLPDNASYRRYADLQRPAAVWNVVAAPELGLTLKTWCFPVVGCIGYRGYFRREAAQAMADALQAAELGLEVGVYPVPAYSTLGKLPGNYFADPLLNTFLHYPEAELARLVFHELAHQVAYADNDTGFNEAFATAVETLGRERWLARPGETAAAAEYRVFNARQQDFRALTTQTREQLAALYDGPLPAADKRREKARLMAEFRSRYQALKTERWGGYAGYDAWIARANNTSFGVMAAYHQDVPRFLQLFEQQGRDFERFYAEVRRLAALSGEQRQAEMQRLDPPS